MLLDIIGSLGPQSIRVEFLLILSSTLGSAALNYMIWGIILRHAHLWHHDCHFMIVIGCVVPALAQLHLELR